MEFIPNPMYQGTFAIPKQPIIGYHTNRTVVCLYTYLPGLKIGANAADGNHVYIRPRTGDGLAT